MDTGIEVTNARRAALVVGTTAGGVLVATLAVVATMVVPLLSRVDSTLATLNSSLPVLEQVGPDVATLEEDVGAIAPDVDDIDDTVVEVERGLGVIDRSVAGLRGPLGTLDGSVGRVDGSVQDLGQRIDAVTSAIESLQGRLTPLGHLPDLLDELRATRRHVDAIATNTDGLAAALQRVTRLLEETEQHVENLDRKTGPVLVPEGP